MRTRARVLYRAAPLAVVAALFLPAAAFAHGLVGDFDPNRSIGSYLWLGAKHMLLGWDHLLFIAGVVLFAGGARSAAKLVSIFVLGHSITLMIATLAEWQIDPSRVDAIIALSLVYVGVQGIRGKPADMRLTLAIVFAFGLVHGLGLSTRLQELGLPESGLVPRILVFNVGIELGQLTALLVIVGIVTLALRLLRGSAAGATAGLRRARGRRLRRRDRRRHLARRDHPHRPGRADERLVHRERRSRPPSRRPRTTATRPSTAPRRTSPSRASPT